jgi:hypothetical protein
MHVVACGYVPTESGGSQTERGSSKKSVPNDLTYPFPLIVETLARLRSRSCIIDGEKHSLDLPIRP